MAEDGACVRLSLDDYHILSSSYDTVTHCLFPNVLECVFIPILRRTHEKTTLVTSQTARDEVSMR